MILYDKVVDEDGNQIFGDTPGEVYMWCMRKENRKRALWVINSKTGNTETIDDYLFAVP